ncbi:MAG: hypothetical protein K5839_05765, partial [Treponemataceae bacterium]|nr:hypothetical protein [Treponemataceae bacterium]
MMGFLQVFYSVFSAVLTALAIPNELLKLGSPLYGMIALIPLFMAVHNAKSFRIAGHLTGLQIFLTHILSSYWLGKFKDFAIFTLGASGLAYYVFGYVFGNYLYSVFYYTEKKNPLSKYSLSNIKTPFYQILGFASIWTIYEWFKSTDWLAYPWGTLFMSTYRWNTIKQICSITGTMGLTYLLALFSSVIGEGIILLPEIRKFKSTSYRIKSYTYTAIYCIMLFVMSFFYGIYQYTTEHPVEKSFTAIVTQPNIDPWRCSSQVKIATSMKLTNQAIEECRKTGKTPDLIIWNESTLSNASFFPEAYDIAYNNMPSKNSLIHEQKRISTYNQNINKMNEILSKANGKNKKTKLKPMKEITAETIDSAQPLNSYLKAIKTPLIAGGPAHYQGS